MMTENTVGTNPTLSINNAKRTIAAMMRICGRHMLGWISPPRTASDRSVTKAPTPISAQDSTVGKNPGPMRVSAPKAKSRLM